MASRAMLELVANLKDNVSGKLGGITGLLGKVGLAGLGLSAVTAGVGGLVDAFGELAGAAASERLETDLLAKSIANADKAFKGGADALDDYVRAGEAKAFADSEVRASLSKLTGVTNSVTKASELQALAMDVARAKGISLEAATTAIAKAQGGQLAGLRKLGVEVGKETKLEDALAELRTESAGAADLYAKSSVGAAAISAAAWENAKEDIGAALLPLQEQIMGGFAAFLQGPEFQGAIQFVTNLIGTQLPRAIQFLQTTFGPLIETIKGFAAFIANAFAGDELLGIEEFVTGLPEPLMNLANMIGEIVSNWRGFFEAIGAGQDILTAFSELIRNNLQSALMALGIPPETRDAILGTFDQIRAFLAEAIPAAIQFVSDAWNNVLLPALQTAWTFITETLLPIFVQLAAFMTEQIGAAVTTMAAFWTEHLQPALQEVWAHVQEKIFPLFGELVTWLKETIPPAVQTLSDFWTNVLQPAFAAVWTFIGESIIPIFRDLLVWLIDNIPPAITALAGFWSETLWPALQQVWAFIDENIIPIFGTVLAWLEENLPPAIKALAAFWTDTLEPALNSVWTFINDNILPIFGEVLAWMQDTIPPVIKSLSDLWTNTLQPALNALWTFIDTNLLPVFKSLNEFGIAVVHKALEALAGLWQNVLQPALSALVTEGLGQVKTAFDTLAFAWTNVLSPALNEFWNFIAASLQPAIDGISAALATAKSWFDQLAAATEAITLPDWLTPGSPTPLEYGLLGINDALAKVNREGLPGFTRQLDGAGSAAADVGATLSTDMLASLNDGSLVAGAREAIVGLQELFYRYVRDDEQEYSLAWHWKTAFQFMFGFVNETWTPMIKELVKGSFTTLAEIIGSSTQGFASGYIAQWTAMADATIAQIARINAAVGGLPAAGYIPPTGGGASGATGTTGGSGGNGGPGAVNASSAGGMTGQGFTFTGPIYINGVYQPNATVSSSGNKAAMRRRGLQQVPG